MRYQDYVIAATREAAAESFKYAKAVPTDKLDWKPEGTGRSVLDMCRELAQCCGWADGILKGEGMPDFDEASMAEMEARQAQWTTVEACEAEAMRQLDAFAETALAFPDERLSETYVLPFDGGKPISMRENMDYPRWNFTYHTGQIAYIQTMYGDRQVYW